MGSNFCSDAENGCCAYLRTYQDQIILVIVNASAETRIKHIPLDKLSHKASLTCSSLLYNQEYVIQNGQCTISLPPWSGEVIQW